MRRNLMITLISLSSISSSHANLFRKNVFSINIVNFFSSSSSSTSSTSNNTHNTYIKSAEEYEKEFTVLENETAYSGWRKIIRRKVLNPNGRTTTYDIVSQGGGSIGVFPWDNTTSTTTLIREYHPGVGKFQYGIIGGMYEAKKHSTSLECAQFELEEEAQLCSDTWIPLLNSSSRAASTTTSTTTNVTSTATTDMTHNCPVSFDKYSDNVLYPYIALNCKHVFTPRPLDDDEYIVVEKNVSYKRLWEIITSGEMNIFSSYVCMSALRKLEEMNIFIDKTK